MVNIHQIPRDQWVGNFSESAHIEVFNEYRPRELERIDYALLATSAAKDDIVGYVTVRELDNESAYWQFGGAVENMRSTPLVVAAYRGFIGKMKETGYKRVSTLVENQNVRYLRLAMAHGFRVIGTRATQGKVYVELGLGLEENAI